MCGINFNGMSNASLGVSPQWRWSWPALCGEEGFQIWSSRRHDLGICFQQLCLHIPFLVILAVLSAYYFGRQEGFVTRGKTQLIAIKIRSVLVFCLAVLPIIQIYIDMNEGDGTIQNISFFLSAVQAIAWFTHFIYNLGLKKRLGKSPRGPICMCVTWSFLFALSAICLRSHYLVYKYSFKPNYSVQLAYGFSIFFFIAQIGYALTLIPSEGSTTYFNFSNRYEEISESQALLSQNAYARFTEEGDPTYLGIAMEDVNLMSKLLFYWVNPLIDKGFQGQLSSADDLYDLPLTLSCGYNSAKLHKHFRPRRKSICLRDQTAPSISTSDTIAPDVSFLNVKENNATLLKALHRSFWVPFYSIGILKLIADCSGFAGPLLLNKLVSFIEDKSEDIKWGYIYAAGLMSCTMLASLCDSYFNFLMAVLGLRMRGAVVTTIYRKTLTVSSSVLNSEFSVGEIVNFMSTDTDRIVNSCPSFHSLWSIPFQLAVTLYLLYSLVGVSFVAGVVFSVILIPVNKVIANKIGQLSTKLMEQKDSRVRVITEVLRGMKAIKLYVWEQHFMRIITKIRDQELKYLKWRKYLDALCVYFWATTPVLISIFTFGTYVLLGNKLTAATVFTGIALLNMLISPLNAFPWVLNGLTEAWVSIKRIQRLMNLPDLDLEKFYSQRLLEEHDLQTDAIIINGSFSWRRELSAEEKTAPSCAEREKIGKGKG
ncbi:hypothetical protein NQ317_007536 [Molorchus minor]|uniref:ABC transmembrane type-1 domain-containing protein n=1 Tax=Molorchus minor TaxID=1323400 RepID=A0ABQ9K4V8_9CUCU|nr:hypothetical protein NQ317_007536 [Molorchus minor]